MQTVHAINTLPNARDASASPEVIGIYLAAGAFPLMSASELQELAEDIKANGLAHAIVRDKDRILMDGRNRLAACDMAGVAPRFETYTGNDPVGFIISANLKRRHLNESQRAVIADKLANMTHGGDRRSDQVANLQLEIPKASVAAKMLNVSKRSLGYATVVRKHGSADLIRKVENGEIAVSAAAKQVRPPKPKPKPIILDLTDYAEVRAVASEPITAAAANEAIEPVNTNPPPPAENGRESGSQRDCEESVRQYYDLALQAKAVLHELEKRAVDYLISDRGTIPSEMVEIRDAIVECNLSPAIQVVEAMAETLRAKFRILELRRGGTAFPKRSAS